MYGLNNRIVPGLTQSTTSKASSVAAAAPVRVGTAQSRPAVAQKSEVS